MKKIIVLLTLQVIMNGLLAQKVILDIPINSVDSVKDVSALQNTTYWNVLQSIPFKQDEFGVNSSSVYLGIRRWIEVDVSQLLPITIDFLSFELKVKFEIDSSFGPTSTIPTFGQTILFGQANNIGLLYDYSDSTIQDIEGNLSYKLTNPTSSWISLRLNYLHDSLVKLFVNNILTGTATRNSSPLLDSTAIGSGLYNSSQYLYARVDSLRMEANSNALATISISEVALKDEFFIYPNPSHNIISLKSSSMKIETVELYNSNGILQNVISTNFDQIEVENLEIGVYFLKIVTKRNSYIKRFVKM